MKKYEKITETITKDKHIADICDFCGSNSENDNWDEYGNKSGYSFSSNYVTIKHESQYGWSDSMTTKKLDLDVCPKCFVEKILPFLKEIAVNPIDYQEWYY